MSFVKESVSQKPIVDTVFTIVKKVKTTHLMKILIAGM